jgi:hypothetical protein
MRVAWRGAEIVNVYLDLYSQVLDLFSTGRDKHSLGLSMHKIGTRPTTLPCGRPKGANRQVPASPGVLWQDQLLSEEHVGKAVPGLAHHVGTKW